MRHSRPWSNRDRVDGAFAARWRSPAPLVLALIVVACSVGCVLTPRVDEMIPQVDAGPSLGAVALGIDPALRIFPDEGGLGRSVEPEMFLDIVRGALLQSGLADRIVPEAEADYVLRATAINVQIDVLDKVMGYALAYHVVADWQLRAAGQSTPLFVEVIDTTGSRYRNWAFNGVTRNTLAREAAAKENVEEGLLRITEALSNSSSASQAPGSP